ncbi:hypothetical protein [Brevundimonas sp. NIBR11]|uniref:hypothetical protein n=1 Tax=Brevundimonas sp. NIBR11 TaxID=3015999 RepID=UPI0022F11453|nr:hypothetical protein [Brevundimonas sp. NIBR11]WGM31529.1 hypothetical protein KKHFBJBL_01776 [Brevundimonas sp. NIBR11]
MFNKLSARFAALLLALCAIAAVPGFANAQTISQPNGATGLPGPGVGQSFTATLTGRITRIDFRSRSNVNTTMYIYNGSNGSGVNGMVGTPVYQQAVTLTQSVDNNTGFTTINLTTPFPVIAGQTYSVVFGAGNTAITFTNDYAGGTALSGFTNQGGGWSCCDAPFQVYEELNPVPVPTMTEWAMILFGTVLAGGAALYIQRRRLIA